MTDTIILRPDTGIDNIFFITSSIEEVQEYRNIKFLKTDGHGVACAGKDSKHEICKILKSPQEDISFYFCDFYIERDGQPWFPKYQLTEINIHRNKAKLFGNIIIGQTKIKTVIDKLGQPYRPNYNPLEYYKYGLKIHYIDSVVSSIEMRNVTEK